MRRDSIGTFVAGLLAGGLGTLLAVGGSTSPARAAGYSMLGLSVGAVIGFVALERIQSRDRITRRWWP
jgi:hypothetical protein